jgi:hypothetical protein
MKHRTIKGHGGVDVLIHVFLTLALIGGEWWASCPGHFTSRKRAPGAHWIGGWVGPRTWLDDMERRKFSFLLVLELWPLGRGAHSQSLYQLCYPSSPIQPYWFIKTFLSDIHKIIDKLLCPLIVKSTNSCHGNLPQLLKVIHMHNFVIIEVS